MNYSTLEGMEFPPSDVQSQISYKQRYQSPIKNEGSFFDVNTQQKKSDQSLKKQQIACEEQRIHIEILKSALEDKLYSSGLLKYFKTKERPVDIYVEMMSMKKYAQDQEDQCQKYLINNQQMQQEINDLGRKYNDLQLEYKNCCQKLKQKEKEIQNIHYQNHEVQQKIQNQDNEFQKLLKNQSQLEKNLQNIQESKIQMEDQIDISLRNIVQGEQIQQNNKKLLQIEQFFIQQQQLHQQELDDKCSLNENQHQQLLQQLKLNQQEIENHKIMFDQQKQDFQRERNQMRQLIKIGQEKESSSAQLHTLQIKYKNETEFYQQEMERLEKEQEQTQIELNQSKIEIQKLKSQKNNYDFESHQKKQKLEKDSIQSEIQKLNKDYQNSIYLCELIKNLTQNNTESRHFFENQIYQQTFQYIQNYIKDKNDKIQAYKQQHYDLLQKQQSIQTINQKLQCKINTISIENAWQQTQSQDQKIDMSYNQDYSQIFSESSKNNTRIEKSVSHHLKDNDFQQFLMEVKRQF